MSEPEYVALVTEEEFPTGIRCAVCREVIPTGEEYVCRVSGYMWDQSPMHVLTCTEPACADVSDYVPDKLPNVDPRLN